MDFRDKCLKNDEKLRLIFKIPEPEALIEELPSEPIIETQMEVEPIEEEEEEEVITLNPNKLYESSDDSENDHSENTKVAEIQQVQATIASNNNNNNMSSEAALKPINDSNKREIFHCQFCDVVFPDSISCTTHEQKSHDPVQPYDCLACSFKTDQHSTLIHHIKQTHNFEKPFYCHQCSKTFIRRSDLRKHTFVHSGIRLFSCDICKKSFTRNTNLTKHKRTHSDKFKSWKCTLCPKAYYTNSELSRHVAIHMDRKALVCKFCNQAFMRRDLLELHQKTHLENSPASQGESQMSLQVQPIVFYNQPTEQQQMIPQHHAPMNFYTENMSLNMSPTNGGTSFPVIQPKKEYPIMNQLLSDIGLNSFNQNMVLPVKNFICGICSNAFAKKKDHDRHVMTVHTTVKQFKCEKCPKLFNRKDKLLRHEKLHLTQGNVFNCALCPAVFLRKQMLELHSKIHQMGNGGQQPVVTKSNGFNSAQHIMTDIDEVVAPDSPATLYPMNLSLHNSFNEPMNLSSNDRHEQFSPVLKQEPTVTVDSDDEESGLQIVEEPQIKKSPSLQNIFKPELLETTSDLSSDRPNATTEPDVKPSFDAHVTSMNELSFAMTSRIAELDKLEPSRDLPMEILND